MQMFDSYRVVFVQAGGCGSQLGRTFNSMFQNSSAKPRSIVNMMP